MIRIDAVDAPADPQVEYVVLTTRTRGVHHTVPEMQRVPFDWPAISLGAAGSGESVDLMPSSIARNASAPLWLRITLAVDVRETKLLQAAVAGTGQVVGVFDIRYGYINQIFEIPVPDSLRSLVIDHGITLVTLSGSAPTWIFCDDESGRVPVEQLPHLMAASGEARPSRLLERIASLGSIQPFGWLEGCVLEAQDLLARQDAQQWVPAVNAHLDHFLTESGQLVMEDHFGRISDDVIYAHDAPLPFACLARRRPEHPAIDLADTYLRLDHSLSTEGCYTLAYPAAAIAVQRNDPGLAQRAVALLLERRDALATPWGVYGLPGRFPNWGRSCTWYLLGLTQTLRTLRAAPFTVSGIDEITAELRRVASPILDRQSEDGTWPCMLNEPDTGPETSGTAGIAAGLAAGVALGVLGERHLAASQRAHAALESYLTPDGLLTGVAQNNRAGEELQRSGYRTISQMAMGLYGQLTAELSAKD